MQKVIRSGRAREARLPSGGRLLRNWSFFGLVGRRAASTERLGTDRPAENLDCVGLSVELIGTSPVQITLTQKAIILVRVQPLHRRERPINLRCFVPSRLNRHRPKNRRPEAAIVTRRARLTGRWLSVSGERKSA